MALSVSTHAIAGFVNTNSEYSHSMMDTNNNVTRKQKMLFNNEYDLQEETLYLGASFQGIANFQKSNRASKFGYLMRHPGAGNQVGKGVSEIAVHSLQVQASGFVTPWLAVYSELLYNPEQSFGQGTNTTSTRNLVQVRE